MFHWLIPPLSELCDYLVKHLLYYFTPNREIIKAFLFDTKFPKSKEQKEKSTPPL
jgi:hypothetical protein